MCATKRNREFVPVADLLSKSTAGNEGDWWLRRGLEPLESGTQPVDHDAPTGAPGHERRTRIVRDQAFGVVRYHLPENVLIEPLRVQNEIAGVNVCGEHIVQKQGIMGV